MSRSTASAPKSDAVRAEEAATAVVIGVAGVRDYLRELRGPQE